jgi:Txe/YoeB family toxin of Txe-Axe toxin-antitoxin module
MIFSYQKPKRSVKKPPEFQTQTSFSTAEDELNLKIEDLIDRISRDVFAFQRVKPLEEIEPWRLEMLTNLECRWCRKKWKYVN